MFSLQSRASKLSSSSLLARTISSKHISTVGFIGLGQMGSKLCRHIMADGNKVLVFDQNQQAVKDMQAHGAIPSTVEEMSTKCQRVISILPNDKVVSEVSTQLLQHSKIGGNKELTHISCSTISPDTSRLLATAFKNEGKSYVSAPVFARPDGLAGKTAIWMVSGSEEGKAVARELLQSSGQVHDYGEDPGAANVVKLCGNFMIASSIEAIAESMALAEKYGVDRQQVMGLLSSTIFDCLIYKGYGQRVSQRDHRAGGFSLDLGAKDVGLVLSAAKSAQVPMPFLSVLSDKFTSAQARQRGNFDWSAVGLTAAEDAGIDISADLKRTRDSIAKGETY